MTLGAAGALAVPFLASLAISFSSSAARRLASALLVSCSCFCTAALSREVCALDLAPSPPACAVADEASQSTRDDYVSAALGMRKI